MVRRESIDFFDTDMKPDSESSGSSILARIKSIRFLSRENMLALLLCLLITFLIIMASDNAPQWIYQGF